jgi:hypothetical protein
VEVWDASGTKVATHELTPDSPRWQTRFAEPGEYVFKGAAMNMEGKASANMCEAKTYINFPPVCNIWTSCIPCEDYVGRPITFDASNSTDPDGEVVKADFEITDAAGNVIDTFTDSEKPFTWEKVFDKPGVYTATAVVTDDFGAMSNPCKIEVEVTQKRLFGLVEVGPLLAKGTYTTFLFARFGMFYKVAPETLSFILRAGPAFPLADTEIWKTFFMIDGLFNIHFGPAYLGAGLGYTTKEQETRDAGFDVIGNFGVEVFNNYKSIGSIFFEGRIPLGEERPVKDMHKLLLGFRFVF